MSSLHHHIDTIVFCYHILNEKKVPLKSHELQNYMYMDRYIYIYITELKLLLDCLYMPILEVGVEYIHIPVVPHKAVAEVSKIGNHRRDWLL